MLCLVLVVGTPGGLQAEVHPWYDISYICNERHCWFKKKSVVIRFSLVQLNELCAGLNPPPPFTVALFIALVIKTLTRVC